MQKIGQLYKKELRLFELFILKERRGINREWIYVDMFDDNDAADLWLKNETKWSKEDTYSTNDGDKIIYRCNLLNDKINEGVIKSGIAFTIQPKSLKDKRQNEDIVQNQEDKIISHLLMYLNAAKPTRKRKQIEVTENTDEISNKKPKSGENQNNSSYANLREKNFFQSAKCRKFSRSLFSAQLFLVFCNSSGVRLNAAEGFGDLTTKLSVLTLLDLFSAACDG
ncbi:hypothetical protein BpHYR1_005982 [Brachionus plicatilis]|uniref:Uncharacterized protein n=1 Tax=Brachionus plicatilis TaxID=10195 RepID=A0A3M7SW94_BRAPC|nr:hypothetical protein BpHYR1_005982 [Brachionus plicatilis]